MQVWDEPALIDRSCKDVSTIPMHEAAIPFSSISGENVGTMFSGIFLQVM